MINVPADPKLHPDIKVIVHTAADMLTGDGVFADTDLIRIPMNGYLLVNATTTATGDSTLAVPQINHQENRTNNIPVLGAGVMPDILRMANYKIPIEKGETPRVLYDEVTDTAATFLGAFYQGRGKLTSPVALNTPDILVYKSNITATAQNVLDGTELDDCPFPGYLYTWSSSDVQTATIQVRQKGHRTGNTSVVPTYAAGTAVNIAAYPPFKEYIPATGQPTVTLTIASGECAVLCCFYIDWRSVPRSVQQRMGY